LLRLACFFNVPQSVPVRPPDQRRDPEMTSIKKLFTLAFLALAALSASATSTTGAVAYVSVDPNGHFYAGLANGPNLCGIGTTPTYYYEAYVLVSHPGYQTMFAAFLAAKTSGKQVQINATQNGNYCQIDSVKFY
jgi:hypothetical protein